MPYIKADFRKMNSVLSDFWNTADGIGAVREQVASARQNLDWDVACENYIDEALRGIEREADKLQARAQKTVYFLGYAIEQYGRTENGENWAAVFDTLERQRASTVQKTAKSMLSKFGVIGKAVSSVMEPFANWKNTGVFRFGGENDSTQLKFFKAAKAVVGVATAAESFLKIQKKYDKIKNFKNIGKAYATNSQHGDYLWKNLFGLQKNDFKKALGDGAVVTKSGRGTMFLGSNLKSGFKQGFKNKFFNSAGKLSALRVTGVVLDVGIKAVEKIKEYKEGKIKTVGRAIVETAAEASFDLALEVGVSTLINAGLIAIGAVNAPALAVGVASVAVVSGVNALSKWLTKKTLTEHAGDFFGDTWDNVTQLGKKAASKRKKAILEKYSGCKDMFVDKTKAKLRTAALKPAWV